MTAEQVAKVPAANIHVSGEAFVRVWARALELGERLEMDYYVIGVIRTCDWLADRPVWSPVLGKMEVPASPVTQRHYAAVPETILDEYLAAPRAVAPLVAAPGGRLDHMDTQHASSAAPKVALVRALRCSSTSACNRVRIFRASRSSVGRPGQEVLPTGRRVGSGVHPHLEGPCHAGGCCHARARR